MSYGAKHIARHPLLWMVVILSIAATPSYQWILSQMPVTLREYSIYNYGAKCDGTTNDAAAINSAEAAAAAAGGGKVTGWGVCAISTALVYNDARVTFSSKHYGDGDHDVGSNDNGWVLKWTGAGGATMMTISPISGVSNQALYGNGIQGMTFDCNNSAAIGLELESVKGGTWNGLYFLECTTAGLDTVPVASLGEASDVQGNNFIGIRSRIVLSTGIAIRLRGNATHNTSFDTFYSSQIVYKNGVGIQQQNSDNISMVDTQMVRAAAGSGIGVEITGDANGSARSNFFYDLSPGAGGVTIRGTETNPTAAINIQFIGYDITNSPPAPVLGTGVTGITVYKENGHISGSGGQNFLLGSSDSELTSAASVPTTSTYSAALYNGSSDGFWFGDGTGKWLLRQDGSHNFQIVRQAGSGGVLLSAQVTNTGGLINGGTTFTLGTGTGACTTNSTLTGGTAGGSFLCTGTAGASTIVINLPTAAHGWSCTGGDITSGVAWAQVTPTSANACKLTGTIATTSDQVNFTAIGY